MVSLGVVDPTPLEVYYNKPKLWYCMLVHKTFIDGTDVMIKVKGLIHILK